MRKTMVRGGWVAAAVAAVALVVGAQGPPGHGGFGGRGPGPGPGGPMEGTFEFGGLVGGFGGKTITGKPFQATFTITRTETLPGNTITNVTTGTVARDTDGSTYRDVKLPAIGPWASSGKSPEFVYIRNLSTMMEYIENLAKQTYEAFAIHTHTPPPGGKADHGWQGKESGKGPYSGSNPNVVVTDTSSTYTDPSTSTKYTVDDKKITRTIPMGQIGNSSPIIITSERLYYPGLDLVLEETHSDPRFGSSTYALASISQTPSVSFTPPSGFTQVKGRGFGHDAGRRGGHQPPPPPPPAD